MVCPFSKRSAWSEASNIEAKSSSGSLTALSWSMVIFVEHVDCSSLVS
jgi:hypothetical protein